MPREVPNHRFPSRSSNSAVIVPWPWVLAPFVKTPLALTLTSPPVVPTHRFESRSRIMLRIWLCRREGGTPSAVISLPFHRVIPLSVPIHNSPFSPASRQLILASGSFIPLG